MTKDVLSIFIDESGDFGSYEQHAPFYLVSMVLHDQTIDIADNLNGLSVHLKNLGLKKHAIHTGPLIRRESIYSYDRMEDRKRIFNALFNFARKLDFNYICAQIKKSECPDVISMTAKLSRSIANALIKHSDYLNQFKQIIIYYDNGQVELTKILTSVFNSLFSNVEFRKVHPMDYKLFQIADLICTMELLFQKAESNTFSRSETEFFCSIRDFKKNYWKALIKKRL